MSENYAYGMWVIAAFNEGIRYPHMDARTLCPQFVEACLVLHRRIMALQAAVTGT